MKLLKGLIASSIMIALVVIAAVAMMRQPSSLPSTNPVTTTNPTASPVSRVSPASNACIITIDGVQYDVTKLRFSHSGGNVFQCGTDMSAIFWAQHNQGTLRQMQQYRI